ncbi:hypothetical protein SAMN05444008_11572 [Cnuella takakiae]|uniref:Uncharacterized protein n=1 Tax=Cnuella takakiae TaxID=1302690 RepID=A0A1M5G382_9BACT|nr:hypothetical protein [Cnuella takakiae]OLY92306.1 hypothetical protein BUE76_10670 [Cnuella takakiae]SHF97892.1 hypothetical protein SAMN05444008_11572 [Cnuella takakiae]
MKYRGKTIQLDPDKVYVGVARYGWKKKGIARLTAPAVRYFTKKPFNHGWLLINIMGTWVMFESAEGGCTAVLAEQPEIGIDRKGSRIQIRPYIGPLSRTDVLKAASLQLGLKYDHINLVVHQLIYRCGGPWIGRTGPDAKGKVQCFEFLFNCFNLPQAWLASGAEFDQQTVFDNPIFNEI